MLCPTGMGYKYVEQLLLLLIPSSRDTKCPLSVHGYLLTLHCFIYQLSASRADWTVLPEDNVFWAYRSECQIPVSQEQVL